MKRATRQWKVLSLAGAAALLVFAQGIDAPVGTHSSAGLVPSAHAQSGQGYTTSKAVFDAYTQAQEFLEAEDPEGALRVVRAVLNNAEEGELNPLERGILYRFIAQVELQQERYPQAIRALEQAIATGAFQGPELAELHFFLGGLLLAIERYDESIVQLNKFFAIAENPNAAAYYLLAQAYAVSERWREALEPAQTAVQKSESPNENYLRLLAAVYINLSRWRDAVPLLEQLVRLFPTKDEYWAQLAAGYQELGRERDVYAIQELRYKQGFLDKSRDIMILADLHAFYGYPFKAARLVEREIEAGRVDRTTENWEKLGNYWLAAREYAKARVALTRAERNSNNGKIAFQVAGTYAQDENWGETERFLLRALNKGGLTRNQQADAWLLLGHARNNLGRRQAAIEAFERAARFDKTKDDAETWLTFLRNQIEIERQKILFDAINRLNKLIDQNNAALTDVDALRDVALQALSSARRARDAQSELARSRALEEYEIRVREAETILARQQDAMQTQIPESRNTLDAVRSIDNVDDDVKEAADRLEELVNEREEKVANAQDDLRRAAGIIDFINGDGEDPDVTDPVEEPEGGDEEGDNE